MAKKERLNDRANEAISKYKLLSAYGAPGSLIHTQYGSVIVSCIEEWGFLKKVSSIHKEFVGKVPDNELRIRVIEDAKRERNGSISISNDRRLLESLQLRKDLPELKYLVLVPDVELTTYNNKIKGDGATELSIPSSYMPKIFRDDFDNVKTYHDWYIKWVTRKNDENEKIDQYAERFHPPKYFSNSKETNLIQDNVVLLCEHGHISDFPWSKYLRWRIDEPGAIVKGETINLFNYENCCHKPEIKISSNTANASGFDGKWLKCCNPGCRGGKGTSLKGIMGAKIKCAGHKPWESVTGNSKYHSGDKDVRGKTPPSENCENDHPMTVALTTGNNIYFSNVTSSIYLHDKLFESERALKILTLKNELEQAKKDCDYARCIEIDQKIKQLENEKPEEKEEVLSDSERELALRYDEYKALLKDVELLNLEEKDLKVADVTCNLIDSHKEYFDRILRIDNMKLTSVQLDFSRVVPAGSDAENAKPKNIFKSASGIVEVYPATESFGEGIFFSFNHDLIDDFVSQSSEEVLKENIIVSNVKNKLTELQKSANKFNSGAIKYANEFNWQLYLVHTFSHLIMRELEFRCGYPTASLSERLYVSNDENKKMYGCLIFTAEGAEGSMGGLVAQTRSKNLENLLQSAIRRATICNSDPLCWTSEGQGLFDLNFASCFSCSLVSETSCEHRNLYLDRKILVDPDFGFFKNLL